MAIQAGDIVWKVLLEANRFEQDLDAAGKSVDGFKTKFAGTIKVAQAVGAAMTAAGASIMGALGLSLKTYVDMGSALLEMSQRTGIAVESLSGLKYAAEQSGTSIDTLENSIKRMQMNITGSFDESVEATSEWNTAIAESQDYLASLEAQLNETLPGGKYDAILAAIADEQANLNELMAQGPTQAGFAEALDKIGISLESLKGLNPEEQFRRIAEGIKAIQDPTEQAGVAMQIFGKAGTEIIPLLEADIDSLMARARALGLVMDEEAATKAEAFGDTLADLKGVFQGLMIQAGPIIVDLLVPMVEKIIEVTAAVGAWAQANPGLTEALVITAAAIGGIMIVLGPILVALPGLIAAFSAVGPVVAAVGAVLAALAGPVGLIVAAIAAAAIAIYVYWEEIIAGVNWLWEQFKAAFDAGLQIADALFSAWLDGVKAHWELLKAAWEAGIEFVRAAFDLWVSWQKAKIEAVLQVFRWLGDGVVGVFDWIVSRMQSAEGYVRGILNSIISMVQEAIAWVANMPANVGGFFGFQSGGVVPAFASGGVVPDGVAQAVPRYASGGNVRPVMVGELGPEIAMLPIGTRILSSGQSKTALRGGAAANLNFEGMYIGQVGLAGDGTTFTERDTRDIWERIAPYAYRDFSQKLQRARAVSG